MKDEPAVFALVVFGRPSRKVTDVAEVVVAFENSAAATEFARARRVGEYAVVPLGFIATTVPVVPHPRPATSVGRARPTAPAMSAGPATPTALAVQAP